MPNILISALFSNFRPKSKGSFYLSYEYSPDSNFHYKILSTNKKLLEEIADYFGASVLRRQIYDPRVPNSYTPDSKPRNMCMMYIDPESMQYYLNELTHSSLNTEDLKQELFQNKNRGLGEVAYGSEAMVRVEPGLSPEQIEDQLPRFDIFKTLYFHVYSKQLFKNSSSTMKRLLESGEVNNIVEVYTYCQRNPDSRSAMVFQYAKEVENKLQEIFDLPSLDEDDFIEEFKDKHNEGNYNLFSTMKTEIKNNRMNTLKDIVAYCVLNPKSRSARVLEEVIEQYKIPSPKP